MISHVTRSLFRFTPLLVALALAAPLGMASSAHANGTNDVSFDTPTFPCTTGTFGGNITVADSTFVGYIRVDLLENPSQAYFIATTYVHFDGTSATEPYSFSSFTGNPSGNGSYIATANGAYSSSSSSTADLNSDFDSSVNNTKTGSFHCLSTTLSSYSRMSIKSANGVHTLRWFSAQHVLGFNVVAGGTKLNSKLVTSTSHWYTFATTHSTRHLHITAVFASGSTR
jgi:hypothetical protein